MLRFPGLVTAIALTLHSCAALACSCMPPESRTLEQITASGDTVVMGHVMSVKKTGGTDINSGHLIYRVRVDAAVNLPDLQEIEVRTAPNGALCGINLPVGSFQILFVYRRDQAYSAGLCGNLSRPQSEEEARGWWRDFQAGGVLPPRR